MSFLAVADGMESTDDAALCELLEIVDAWSPPARDLSPPPSHSPSSGVSSVSSTSSDSGDSSGCSKQRGKRTRNPEVDVRRRLKKKKERAALNTLVRELEDQCEQLRQVRRCQCASPTTTAARRTPSSRCAELDELFVTSLRDNQQLKTETARNAVLIRALHDAISGPKDAVEVTDKILDAAMKMHRSTLQDMHAGLETVFNSFPPLSPNQPFFLRSDTKFDVTGTPQIELSTSLQLPWDFRRTSAVFAKAIIQLSPFGHSVAECLETQAESAEQGYSLGGCASNASPGLRSIGLVRKRQNSNSTVVMWSSLIFHSTIGMAFVGRARIRIRGLSSQLSLVEAFTEVTSTELPSASRYPEIDHETLVSVQSALVRAFGDRVGMKHKAFLKRMLAVSGKSHLAATINL